MKGYSTKYSALQFGLCTKVIRQLELMLLVVFLCFWVNVTSGTSPEPAVSNPIPLDNNSANSDLAELSWTYPDPNVPGEILTADLWLQIAGGIDPNFTEDEKLTPAPTTNNFVPVTVLPNLIYEWQVIAYDPTYGTITGPVWTFNTITDDTINVVDFGADNTGNIDNTALLTRLHATGKTIYYPNGTYLFNGKTLNLAGGVIFESRDSVIVRNNISNQNILVFDDFDNLIGLQHNHLELDDGDMGAGYKMDVGNLVQPPFSQANFETKVDVLPYWYNDFGLDCKRLGIYDFGWKGWYYWSWNFHDAGDYFDDPYEPAVHPLLGFYRGDDPIVLDWQCYWLREYGIEGVILISSYSHSHPAMHFDDWADPATTYHWIYQLFHNVPNFQGLKYVISMPIEWMSVSEATPEVQEKFINDWFNVIDKFYFQYDNFYSIKKNGKIYPVVYVFEEESIRGILDHWNGITNMLNLYLDTADYFQANGYDGVAFFSRNVTVLGTPEYLEANGILHFYTNYGPSGFDALKDVAVDPNYLLSEENQFTFNDLVEAYSPSPGINNIINIFTNAHTHDPHPSQWHAPGSTPELFKELVTKAVNTVYQNDMFKILTGYNVAEWSEGSSSFQPDMKFRFGYLDALYETLTSESNGDFNDDGKTDIDDLAFMLMHWLGSDSLADIAPSPNGDGIVDFQDFTLLAKYW